MWSKNICRFSSTLRLSTATNLHKGARCCCANYSMSTKTERGSPRPHYTSLPHKSLRHMSTSGGGGGGYTEVYIGAAVGAGILGYVFYKVQQSKREQEMEFKTIKDRITSKVKDEREKKLSGTGTIGSFQLDSNPSDTESQAEQTEQTSSRELKAKKSDILLRKKEVMEENTKEMLEKLEREKAIDWSQVPEIPEYAPYLLIGGGVASLEAYKAIKTNDPTAKVLMISEEDYPPYNRPLLSKQIWFDPDPELYKEFEYTGRKGKPISMFMKAGLYMEPKRLPYAENGGLGFLQNTKVVKLDSVRQKVTLENGKEIRFDKCLIATGGKPRTLGAFKKASAAVKERTTVFRNLKDMWKLRQAVDKSKDIAIIGGGFLGSELALGIKHRGKDVTVHHIFQEKGHMGKVLPEFLSKYVSNKIREEDIDVISETQVLEAQYTNDKVKLLLSNGSMLNVDHVVVAIGIEPNTDLAKSGQLEIDPEYGGFRVNTELQARTNIWAAGDCSCFYDTKLARRRVEHYDHAEVTGRLAGFNMTGDNRPFKYQSTFWSTLGKIVDYEAIGLVDSSLDTYSAFRQPKDGQRMTKDASGKPLAIPDILKNDTSVEQEYEPGVVLYLRGREVVGVVLWNLDSFSGNPSRMDIARQLIADGVKGKKLAEIVKLFNIYED